VPRGRPATVWPPESGQWLKASPAKRVGAYSSSRVRILPSPLLPHPADPSAKDMKLLALLAPCIAGASAFLLFGLQRQRRRPDPLWTLAHVTAAFAACPSSERPSTAIRRDIWERASPCPPDPPRPPPDTSMGPASSRSRRSLAATDRTAYVGRGGAGVLAGSGRSQAHRIRPHGGLTIAAVEGPWFGVPPPDSSERRNSPPLDPRRPSDLASRRRI